MLNFSFCSSRVVVVTNCVFVSVVQIGVKSIVVFVNKADMIDDPEMLELVRIFQ